MNNEALFLEIVCAVFLSSFTSYIGGRVHQWRRQDDERKTAFGEGFLRASATLVAMAAKGQKNELIATTKRPSIEPGTTRTRISFDQH